MPQTPGRSKLKSTQRKVHSQPASKGSYKYFQIQCQTHCILYNKAHNNTSLHEQKQKTQSIKVRKEIKDKCDDSCMNGKSQKVI